MTQCHDSASATTSLSSRRSSWRFPFLSAVLVAAWLPASPEAAPAPVQPDAAGRARLSASYGKLPLSFEANSGQQADPVKFLSRGHGYNLFLTNNEAVLVLAPAAKAVGPKAGQPAAASDAATVLRTQLVAANPAAKASAEEKLPGKVSYFIGRDPKKWRTDRATYREVRYAQVYPGIDLVYHGNQRQLEYDFVVAPGADPARIRFRIAGAEKMTVDKQGVLVLETAGGAVRWDKPGIYQEQGGNRRAVAGQFVVRSGAEVGFKVASYDATKPLVIDPTLVYSTFLGGSTGVYSGGDNGKAIVVDTSGNAYVVGQTFAGDFPTTAGALQVRKHGAASDAFVSKLDPTGSSLLASTYLGGTQTDYGTAVAVDAAGNIYVTGQSDSTDFPVTAGAFQTALHGASNAFVTKLNPTGTSLIYSTYLGGSTLYAGDLGWGIGVDASGNAYIGGNTTSADFPTTAGAFQTVLKGYSDLFVAKLNPSGSGLVFSTLIGGNQADICFGGFALDASGNTYITGDTLSNDFPTTPGAFQTRYLGRVYDAFLTKLNPAGSALVYSTYIAGTNDETGWAVAVGASGNAYVTGETFSSDFPVTAGAFQTTLSGTRDAFVIAFNPTGTAALYSTYLGGSGSDEEMGHGVAVDGSGNAYVAGQTPSTDFPTTPNAFQKTFGGGGANVGFVTQFDPTGTLLYSTYFGGEGAGYCNNITLDASGNYYLTGGASAGFPVTPGAFETTAPGGGDAFIAKFAGASPTPTPTPTPTITPTPTPPPIVLTVASRNQGSTKQVRLTYTGAGSSQVDIKRNGAVIATVPNSGTYFDTLTDRGIYTYEVCEAGTSNCSNEVKVKFAGP